MPRRRAPPSTTTKLKQEKEPRRKRPRIKPREHQHARQIVVTFPHGTAHLAREIPLLQDTPLRKGDKPRTAVLKGNRLVVLVARPLVPNDSHVQVPGSQPTKRAGIHRVTARLHTRMPASFASVEVVAFEYQYFTIGELQQHATIRVVQAPPEIQQVPGECAFELVQNLTLKGRQPTNYARRPVRGHGA